MKNIFLHGYLSIICKFGQHINTQTYTHTHIIHTYPRMKKLTQINIWRYRQNFSKSSLLSGQFFSTFGSFIKPSYNVVLSTAQKQRIFSLILILSFNLLIQKEITGLPWWRSGWESACQCRGHGFEPWSGRIPHAAEQLGPWATITEPARLEPVLHNKRGRDNERPAHRNEEWPPLAATRESPRTENNTAINK